MFQVSKEMQAGKFNYAADFGETFSPVVPLIFAMFKSSMNSFVCDRIMSATYLAKYAAGVVNLRSPVKAASSAL